MAYTIAFSGQSPMTKRPSMIRTKSSDLNSVIIKDI